jgi:hypothetical protein
MKKTTASTMSQVKASAPDEATVPMVSTPTMVHSRKNRMSKRLKCLRSFCRSAAALGGSPISASFLWLFGRFRGWSYVA